MRQFAAARLDADGEQQARRRHLAWCLAEAAGLEHADPAGPGWPEIFDAAADEFRAALGWSAARPGLRDDACRMAAALSGLLFSRGRIREAQQRYEQAATLAVDAAAAAPALERAAATAGIRTLGEEALRLDRAAAAAYLQAGDSAAASVAFARAAGHIDRFAGMYARRPAADTAAALLADARALAADDLRAAAAIGCAEAQEASASGGHAAGRAAQALRLARQAGDPLLISAALDAITLGQMTDGDISAAASTAAERIGTLPALDRDPRVAFELKDALHTAIFTGVAAGQVARSLEHAERHYALPFLREERHLGAEDLVAPAALAGQWDRVLLLGQEWLRGWERAGRPVAVGRSLAPAAVAMAHGLRGHDRARTSWLAILAAVRGVAERDAVRGSGCGEVFEAIVLLDRGQPDSALDLLTADVAASSSWRIRLWRQWITALRAEAAVLARAPDAAALIAQARATAGGNPVSLGLTRRAAALYRGDTAAVHGTAAAFARAGVPVPAGPRARTRDRPATARARAMRRPRRWSGGPGWSTTTCPLVTEHSSVMSSPAPNQQARMISSAASRPVPLPDPPGRQGHEVVAGSSPIQSHSGTVPPSSAFSTRVLSARCRALKQIGQTSSLPPACLPPARRCCEAGSGQGRLVAWYSRSTTSTRCAALRGSPTAWSRRTSSCCCSRPRRRPRSWARPARRRYAASRRSSTATRPSRAS